MGFMPCTMLCRSRCCLHHHVGIPSSHHYLDQHISLWMENGASCPFHSSCCISLGLMEFVGFDHVIKVLFHTQITLCDPIKFAPIWLVSYGLIILYPHSKIICPYRSSRSCPWLVVSWIAFYSRPLVPNMLFPYLLMLVCPLHHVGGLTTWILKRECILRMYIKR